LVGCPSALADRKAKIYKKFHLPASQGRFIFELTGKCISNKKVKEQMNKNVT
jgi:hypothetical protein